MSSSSSSSSDSEPPVQKKNFEYPSKKRKDSDSDFVDHAKKAKITSNRILKKPIERSKSSSSSSSSDSEPPAPKRNSENISKKRKDSDSDSDFKDNEKKTKIVVNRTLAKPIEKSKSLHYSTPVQGGDVATSRLNFQKMLMGSNNKLAELMKNKNKVSTSPSPIKGILKDKKGPTATSSKNNSIEKSKFDINFSPVASSTQREPSRKIKKPKIETVSDSGDSSSNSDEPKQESRQRKESGTDSESSSSSSQSEDDKIAKSHHTKSSSLSNTAKKQQEHLKKIKNKAKQQHSSSDSEEFVKLPTKKIHSVKAQKKQSSIEEQSDSTPNNLQERKRTASLSKDIRRSSSDSDSSVSNKSPPKKAKVQAKPHKESSASDSDQNFKSNTNPTKSVQLVKKFESDHKNYLKITEHHDLFKKFNNEEVFIVQIPKSLDAKKLIGTKISLSNRTRVPEKSRKYESIPSSAAQDPIMIFTNTEKIHCINPAGSIKLQRHVKSKHAPNLPGHSNEMVEFPGNLKERHPLFGADYSDKINLEQLIEMKLQAAIASFTKQKKKKKKKKEKRESHASATKEEEIFQLLNPTDTPKDDMKLKEKQITESIFEINLPKKKKKKNKDKHSDLLEVEDSISLGYSDEVSVKKKKHKKHKEREVETNNLQEAKKKKKKKKHETYE